MYISNLLLRLKRITYVLLLVCALPPGFSSAAENIVTNSVDRNNFRQNNTKLIISTHRLENQVKLTLSLHREGRSVQWVNRYYNRFATGEDFKLWGKKDYWTTPKELLLVGSGDCEDVAVAKYDFLRRMGVSEDRLRFAYVKAFNQEKSSIEDHLVLLYKEPDGHFFLVLDNLTNSIKQKQERNDLIYQYAFNRLGQWSMNPNITEAQIAQSSIIRSWNQLLLKMP